MTATAGRAQIKLDVERKGEPISGVLEDGSGIRRPFLGWIELISAIEDARAKPGEQP